MIYVQVISCPPPLWNTGGTARQSDALIKLMAENATVILVTQKNHSGLAKKYYKDYKNVVIFSTYFDLSKTKPLSFLRLRKLGSVISSLLRSKREKVIVHCLESKSLLTLQMAIFCKFREFEFWLSPFGQGSAILNTRVSLVSFVYKKIIRDADKVICQNLDEYDLFIRHSDQNNIYEIPLLIDPEVYLQSQLIKEKKTGPMRLGFLGRNTKLKGIIQIIQFVEKISSETNIELSLALSGSDSDVNEAILNSTLNIAVLNIDNNFDRISFYQDIDVFIILPTVQEETSLAALEAALLGCKVIYNRNCMFSNSEMFGDICCLIDDFSVEWLESGLDSASYQRIRKFYYEAIPDNYRKLFND